MSRPKVSILLLTYNHEKYLPQAFAGIFEQNVNFKFEVHVALDLSPDRSRELIERFQNDYPGQVFLHASPVHLGGQKNVIQGYRNLTGQYVTLLDGDDYWCDPNKLQSQVDFLDGHPEYVGVAHNTLLLHEGQPEKPLAKMVPDSCKKVHEITDLITADSYFHVSSLLWRNVFQGELPNPCYHKRHSGDWLISILYAQYGKIEYDPRAMSVYRINPGGVWSRQTDLKRSMDNVDAMAYFHSVLNYRYPREFERLWWASYSMLEQLKQEKIGWPHKQKYILLQKSVARNRPLTLKNRAYRGLYHLVKRIAEFYKV